MAIWFKVQQARPKQKILANDLTMITVRKELVHLIQMLTLSSHFKILELIEDFYFMVKVTDEYYI